MRFTKFLASATAVAVLASVGATIFWTPNKLEIQSVSSQMRFTVRANGESGLLSRPPTWTMSSETLLGLDYLQLNFYDGLGLIVREDLDRKNAFEIKGAKAIASLMIFMGEDDIVKKNEIKDFYNNPQHERSKLFLSQIL